MILTHSAPAGHIAQLFEDHDQRELSSFYFLDVTSEWFDTEAEAVANLRGPAREARLKRLDAQILRWEEKLTELKRQADLIRDKATYVDVKPRR